MKKVLCIIISVIVLLYAVSLGAVMELFIEAKEEEFYNSNYDFPAQHENDIAKQYTDGEITFEDLSNAMAVYDTRGLRMPYTCYFRFMDSAGTFISEAKCVLELKISKGLPSKLSYKYIDIDKYLTDAFKAKYAETASYIESVELYRENNEFIPVALNIVWFGEDEDTSERVILTNNQANVICANNYSTLTWEQGDECITAEIYDRPLRVEKDDTYNYFVAMAEGYAQEARNGNTITNGSLGGSGRMNTFIHYDYSVLNVSIGPYTYYTFSAVGVNLLEAVFDEPSYVRRLIAITAIYALVGAALCGATVYVVKKEN